MELVTLFSSLTTISITFFHTLLLLNTCSCSRNTQCFGNHLCFGYTFTSLSLPQEEIGFNMNILDIGGGFSGSETQLELVSVFLSALRMTLIKDTLGAGKQCTGREVCCDMNLAIPFFSV